MWRSLQEKSSSNSTGCTCWGVCRLHQEQVWLCFTKAPLITQMFSSKNIQHLLIYYQWTFKRLTIFIGAPCLWKQLVYMVVDAQYIGLKESVNLTTLHQQISSRSFTVWFTTNFLLYSFWALDTLRQHYRQFVEVCKRKHYVSEFYQYSYDSKRWEIQ